MKTLVVRLLALGFPLLAFHSAHTVAAETPTSIQKIQSLPAGDFDTKLGALLKKQVAWAKLHEVDADRRAAKGDVQGALQSYYLAMGHVGAVVRGKGWDYEAHELGLKITEVIPGKAAESAGFQVGDIITATDGMSVAGLTKPSFQLLLAYTETTPTRPHVIRIKRGNESLEKRLNRIPVMNFLLDSEVPYRDELEQKVVAFMVAHKLEVKVNENMIAASRELQANLKDAKTSDDLGIALDNIRGATYATPGWADNYFNCGVILESAGRAIEAEKCYRNFLSVRPDDKEAGALTKRFSGLAVKVREEANLRAFEGSWARVKDGVKTEQGMIIYRDGRLLSSKNFLGEVWMAGVIDGEFSASAVQTTTARSMNGGPMEALINKCFKGKMESSGTITLSSDKRTLTLTINNDIDIDSNNCAITRQGKSVLLYVRD